MEGMGPSTRKRDSCADNMGQHFSHVSRPTQCERTWRKGASYARCFWRTCRRVGWLALLLLPLLVLLLGWRNDDAGAAMPATRRMGESSIEAWATPTRSMAG